MAYTPRLRVETDYPIATDSPDHLVPWGTRLNNSQNPRFNDKIYRLFSDLDRPLRILDLGCSGGGFVRDCINDGCIGVGIEGSDFSKNMARSEWALLADRFLFTADITRPFSVLDADSGAQIKFDVITSWEVLEHLPAARLPVLIENVKKHMFEDSIFVGSIACCSDIVNGVELHQTIENLDWWLALFERHGLYDCQEIKTYFNRQYIRGPKQEGAGSHNVCLALKPVPALTVPPLRLKDLVLDNWYFSRPHRAVRQLITFQR